MKFFRSEIHEPLPVYSAYKRNSFDCCAECIAKGSNGKELLMVPKWIVRHRYLFKAHQYLYGVIVERLQVEKGWEDMKKIDILNNLPKNSEHWEYESVIEYTIKHPDALDEYHSRIPKYYSRAHGIMNDEDLDAVIYGRKIIEAA